MNGTPVIGKPVDVTQKLALVDGGAGRVKAQFNSDNGQEIFELERQPCPPHIP